MAKLNIKATKGVSKHTSGTTINKTGDVAYTLRKKEALVSSVLTSFFNEPKAYGNTDSSIIKNARTLIQSDPEFVAKLAVYARNVFHMRTVSQVLAAEVANGAKGNPIVRKMSRSVINRPDDMCNILSYYLKTFKKPIARSLRRGLADAFPQFDEYQLAKYKGTDNDVKLRDVVKLVRPKPTQEHHGELWKRLIEDNLTPPETRETILSANGQSKEVWEELIDSRKLGYMATLRNISNMLKYEISEAHIDKVSSYINNQNAVAKSKQLPFRFLSAYKMISQYSNADKLKLALEKAIEYSTINIPRLDGVTFITTDVSGSMGRPISNNSVITLKDIGCLLASISSHFCDDSICSVFGSDFKLVDLSHTNGILQNMNKIAKCHVGLSTHMHLALNYLIENNIYVDRIVVLSDLQTYRTGSGNTPQQLFNKYKATINPNAWLHSIDLSGYGTSQFIGNKINLLSGWSDKMLNFIKHSEGLDGTLIDSIKNYEL